MAEEEYKFKEEEYDVGEKEQPPTEPPVEEKKPPLPKFKLPINKRILVILGIIVVVFIIFQFVKPKKIEQPTTPPTITTAEPGAQMPVTGQFPELMQKFNENSAKINNIQDELTKTQTVISKLDSAVYNLNTAVQELSKAVQDVTKKQARMQVTGKGKPKVRVPKVVYHLKAVVPGRAWLESSDGTIVTVRPGSKLNDYGTVTEINDRQGIVKTDLGLVIKYGVGDI